MLCWIGMEKVNWTELVIDEEVLQSSILGKIKRTKANCIGEILLKKCLLKYIVEGKWTGQGNEE
jgi:hypothetical protein